LIWTIEREKVLVLIYFYYKNIKKLKSAGKSLGIPADFSETPDLQEILFSEEIRRKILWNTCGFS
jgi:hypothetical protein